MELVWPTHTIAPVMTDSGTSRLFSKHFLKIKLTYIHRHSHTYTHTHTHTHTHTLSLSLMFAVVHFGWNDSYILRSLHSCGYHARQAVNLRLHIPFDGVSWDEMAAIDFPTQVEYVLSQTGAKQLSYIGHSQVHSFGVQRRKSYRFRALYRLSQVWSTTLMWPANSIFSWL